MDRAKELPDWQRPKDETWGKKRKFKIVVDRQTLLVIKIP